MKNEMTIDQKIHVLYSNQCKTRIIQAIALHYPHDQVDSIWHEVQKQYAVFLKNFRTDLGGKANFHNGVAGA